jgi:hypothetical protein
MRFETLPARRPLLQQDLPDGYYLHRESTPQRHSIKEKAMSANRDPLLVTGVFDRQASPRTQQRVPGPRYEQAISTDRAFRAGTAGLLLMIGIVHLHLWLAGYRNLSTIGPLFLVAVVSAGLLAIVVAVRINGAIAVAAAAFAAGTLTANLFSLLLPDGLFRFKEVGVSYSGGFAIASEIGVVALLGVWALQRFRHSRTRPTSLERRELLDRPI